MSDRWPDFFVVGAGRSGTTSLQAWLESHPEVYVCPKSPNHFVAQDDAPAWETPAARAMMRHWVSDREDYLRLFSGAGPELTLGEVSPVYLQSAHAPTRIHSVRPDARIVAILRDPAERALAHFIGRQRDGIEPPGSFATRVAQELERPLPDDVAFGHYVGCGRYHHFLRGYFDRFPPERIRVYLFSDLVASPGTTLADLCRFIGVDDRHSWDFSRRHNRSGLIANPLLRAVWTGSVGVRTWLRPRIPRALRDLLGRPFLSQLDKPTLDAAVRKRIVYLLREDIEALEALLGRDLSSWRS